MIETSKSAPKERKATGPTTRTRMQVGTKWRLTCDAQVQKPQHTIKSNTHGCPWADCVWIDAYKIPAGTEIEIASKFVNHREGNWNCGLVVDLVVNSALVKGVKLQEIKDAVQISEAEVVPVFCIRDTATGLFYEGSEYYHWSHSKHGQDQPIIYTDRWSKYRKWKRLSDVRSALLGFSGYYDGLPDAGSRPDWVNDRKAFTVPQTWEIVKLDKVTKSEVEVIEAMDTFNMAWRLRDLTIKYGSAVRAIYKKIETKKKVDDYLAMLVFYIPEDSMATRHSDDGLTSEEKDDIHEAISTLGKNEIRGATSSSYAVAVQQLDTAMMIKLQYSGSLECRLINLKEMTEVIS
jgi:hypothetical protein